MPEPHLGWCGARSPHALEMDGEVAGAELGLALRGARVEIGELLEDVRHVGGVEVLAQDPRGVGAFHDLVVQLPSDPRLLEHLVGGREAAGEVGRHRVGVRIGDAVHERAEDLPGVGVIVLDRLAGDLDVEHEAVPAELAQQLLLARVPAVDRADADAGEPATAATRASGLAMKTSRAAARIRASLRRASPRRPLRPGSSIAAERS